MDTVAEGGQPDSRAILEHAVRCARERIYATAVAEGRDPSEYGTTLLAALGVKLADQTSVAFFQAGDGLLATWDRVHGALNDVVQPCDEDDDGALFDLTHRRIVETWDETRFAQLQYKGGATGIVLMSDGISGDLFPRQEASSILTSALNELACGATAGCDLLELISYEKRGSGDDRTLVCVLASQLR